MDRYTDKKFLMKISQFFVSTQQTSILYLLVWVWAYIQNATKMCTVLFLAELPKSKSICVAVHIYANAFSLSIAILCPCYFQRGRNLFRKDVTQGQATYSIQVLPRNCPLKPLRVRGGSNAQNPRILERMSPKKSQPVTQVKEFFKNSRVCKKKTHTRTLMSK